MRRCSSSALPVLARPSRVSFSSFPSFPPPSLFRHLQHNLHTTSCLPVHNGEHNHPVKTLPLTAVPAPASATTTFASSPQSPGSLLLLLPGSRQHGQFLRSCCSSSRQFTTSATTPAGPKLLNIYFGSQGGKAMAFAHDLGKLCKKKKWRAEVIDLVNFDQQLLLHPTEPTINVFVVATFGEGAPTDNATKFADWLNAPEREADKPLFAKLDFALFGLGQSAMYPERFNAMGKHTYARLLELGANPLLRRGEGDDAKDIEDDFEKWVEELRSVLANAAPVSDLPPKPTRLPTEDMHAQSDTQPSPFTLFPRSSETTTSTTSTTSTTPTTSTTSTTSATTSTTCTPTGTTCATPQLQRTASTPVEICKPQPKEPSAYNMQTPFWAPAISLKELHSLASPRSVVHVELDLTGSGLSYTTGDYVGVYASNRAHLIRTVCRQLDLDPAMRVKLPDDHPFWNVKRRDNEGELRRDMNGGQGIELERILAHMDITSHPRRSTLRALVPFAQDDREAYKLNFLASNDALSKVDYHSWVLSEDRGLPEILDAFPSLLLNATQLLDVLQPLAPRIYSIASSSLEQPGTVAIAAAVVQYMSPTGRQHYGVASSVLQQLHRGDTVPVFIKTSQFRLPKDNARPLIMVGGGTGVAPFRAFLRERQFLSDQGQPAGKALLYCGFNNRREDFLYQKELTRLNTTQRWFSLRPAFSHEQKWRYFVQHKLLEDATEIYNMLQYEDAVIYVCGAQKTVGMGTHVALLEILQREGNMTTQEAEKYLRGNQSYDSMLKRRCVELSHVMIRYDVNITVTIIDLVIVGKDLGYGTRLTGMCRCSDGRPFALLDLKERHFETVATRVLASEST
eukprot:g58100.t1